VGLKFKRCGRDVYIKKQWCIMSNDAALREGLSAYTLDENDEGKQFVECRGRIAKNSADYTDEFPRAVWKSWSPRTEQCGSANRNDVDDDHDAHVDDKTTFRTAMVAKTVHRQHDSAPTRPLWCSLVTRIVKPKSEEARSPGAVAAMEKELGNMYEKEVWDTKDVYSLHDLLRDDRIKEAMLGRAFAILGIKGEELGVADQKWKARIVFQGSNIRTKSGTTAADLFEEVSNAPASFAAARAALGVAALRGYEATLRDAGAAYLQALMDIEGRTPTFVELPREWWPNEWFHDGAARSRPKYVRPHCRLKRALYGHPEAGALWARALQAILKKQGWEHVPMHPGVCVHKQSGATMVVYVDDLLLVASPAGGNTIWRALEKMVGFKDPEERIGRYLGARYEMTPYDAKNPTNHDTYAST
jgi:hypothetical protein